MDSRERPVNSRERSVNSLELPVNSPERSVNSPERGATQWPVWLLWLALVLTVIAPSAQGAPHDEGLRVQLEARRHATIASELAGRLAALLLEPGETFAEGDPLAQLACTLHEARLSRAQAAEHAARRQLDVAENLDRLQSISVAELTRAQSDVAQMRAERVLEQTLVARCQVLAPYAGRVAKRHVEPGEYVREGDPLLDIYQASDYRVTLLAPSTWLPRLAPGQRFEVRLDETGRRYPAEIVRLGAEVDPLSQSIKVVGRLLDEPGDLLPGMSGSAQFSLAGPSAANE